MYFFYLKQYYNWFALKLSDEGEFWSCKSTGPSLTWKSTSAGLGDPTADSVGLRGKQTGLITIQACFTRAHKVIRSSLYRPEELTNLLEVSTKY